MVTIKCFILFRIFNKLQNPSNTAVLAGLLFIISFSMSHSVVKVAGTEWLEPVFVYGC